MTQPTLNEMAEVEKNRANISARLWKSTTVFFTIGILLFFYGLIPEHGKMHDPQAAFLGAGIVAFCLWMYAYNLVHLW